MIVAELEVWHSRPIAPTRRVAIGRSHLPVDPPPGYGGILLGGIVAAHIGAVDPDLVADLGRLMTQVEKGQRVPQPRLRHRLQQDRIGLQRSRLRLRVDSDAMAFDFDHAHAAPAQLVLGATYSVASLPPAARGPVMATLRWAVTWTGGPGPDLVAALAGAPRRSSLSRAAFENPVGWALAVLGFPSDAPAGSDGAGSGSAAASGGGAHAGGAGMAPVPSRDQPRGSGPAAEPADEDGIGAPRHPMRPDRTAVSRRFRQLLREAHPDHGADSEGAAERIADLTEARRILLSGR